MALACSLLHVGFTKCLNLLFLVPCTAIRRIRRWIRGKEKIIKTTVTGLTGPDAVWNAHDGKQDRKNCWVRVKQMDSYQWFSLLPFFFCFFAWAGISSFSYQLRTEERGWVILTEGPNRWREGVERDWQTEKVLKEPSLSEWMCPQAPVSPV